MRQTRGFALLGLIALMIAAAGCNGSAGDTPAPSAASPSPTTPPAASSASAVPSEAASGPNAVVPDSPAAGIVVRVARGGSQVNGFTLKTNDGTMVEFVIGQLENADEFSADLLADHVDSAAPILVFFRPVGPQLVVYRLEDAG